MPWIRRSPFGRGEDPLTHMVSLLDQEAIASGTPLTENEKSILASEYSTRERIPEALQQKARQLIAQMLQRERGATTEESSKSFASSIEWAGDQAYPNIVVLAEEVITGGGFGRLPALRGRTWLYDRAKLISCAFLAVLFTLLMVAVVAYFSSRK
jgi:hypothetical protein